MHCGAKSIKQSDNSYTAYIHSHSPSVHFEHDACSKFLGHKKENENKEKTRKLHISHLFVNVLVFRLVFKVIF
jgi:hypothetical protein